MLDMRNPALFLLLSAALVFDLPGTAIIDSHAAAWAQDDGDDDDDAGDDDDDGGGGGGGGGGAGGGGGGGGGGGAGGGGGDDDDSGGNDDDGGSGGDDDGGSRGDDDDDDDDGGSRNDDNDDDDDDDDDVRPSRTPANENARTPRRQRQEQQRQQQPQEQRQQQTRRVAPPPAPVELPRRAPREILVAGLSQDDLAALVGQGFEVIEQSDLTRNGTQLLKLRAPSGVNLVDARAAVQALPSGDSADFNHFYRSNEDILPAAGAADLPVLPGPATCDHLNCVALDLIGWPADRPQTCQAPITIGVIDTGVNTEHAALPPGKVEVIRLADPDLPESSATHGTSVLSMLIGTEPRAPGLVPEAQVIAIDVFARENGDERTDAATLIRAIDLLSERGVRVANLSLAGPYNRVLAEVLEKVENEGMLVVAAAGNGGPAARPAWPAASGTVLAVTAVDAFGRIYRKAQRGEHLDVAAPGVEVWAAASVRGVRPRTGTSYATPWVTAAAAVLMAQDESLTPAEAIQRMRSLTSDSGEEGADPVFGQGILSLDAICAEAVPAVLSEPLAQTVAAPAAN